MIEDQILVSDIQGLCYTTEHQWILLGVGGEEHGELHSVVLRAYTRL